MPYSKEDKRRDVYYRKHYNLGLADYNSMRRRQHNSCAVCGRHEHELSRRLVVDHDHKVGRVYGLLCNYCNRYRIGRHHDLDMAISIVRYLENPTDFYAPKKTPKKRRRKKK